MYKGECRSPVCGIVSGMLLTRGSRSNRRRPIIMDNIKILMEREITLR